MRVIKAVQHESRTVVTVCHNPDAPEWVHVVGDQWRGPDGLPLWNDDGSPRRIVSALVPDGETGETCHNCRYNWVVQEVVFDGLEYAELSADELWELVCHACRPSGIPRMIVGLVGRSD